MRKVWIYILCFSVSLYASSQIRVDEAIGVWEVSKDITPAEAAQKALLEAKKEAIRLAGIPEVVNSVSFMVQMVDSIYLDHFQTGISLLHIHSQVKVLSQEIKDEYDAKHQRLFKRAIISAEVYEGVSADKPTLFRLEGLKNSYRTGEHLRFSCLSNDSYYFHLFLFTPQETLLLFPNHYERENYFSSGMRYDFPLNKMIVYEVNKKEDKAKFEQNILLAVATKKNIAFNELPSISHVFEWLYAIPSEERSEVFYSFLCE